jgi:uncharacterized protein
MLNVLKLPPLTPESSNADNYPKFGIMMNQQQQTEAQAAAFRQLVKHLDENKDVQNIDLMNLADFCRNCLAKWYMAGAQEQGLEMNYDQAREAIYGMPFEQWKARYQLPANEHQLALFNEREAAKKAKMLLK